MWRLPTAPRNEAERLKILQACGIMDAMSDARFDRITRLAARIYAADVAFIGLVDDQFQSLISLSTDALGRNVPRNDSVCNTVIESGQPMIVGDLKSDPRFLGHPLVPHITFRFYAGAPIIAAPDLVLGTLCVMMREAGDPDAFDIGPLLDLAAIAASEIVQWQANQELRRQSETDSLTGLPNRRSFDDALGLAIRRSRRTGQPVSLLILDLDHFKQLNDSGGHQMGDEVLARIGKLLAARPRGPLDTVARIGGEEFALILPDTDRDGARAVAEALLARVRKAALPHPTRRSVSASIGGATMSGAELTPSALFKEADVALYAAKTAGRDTFREGRLPAEAHA
ncbi:sensor domain-containing diguanylate cyclase [Xanthobacter sp. V4C-4]|uniref:GGDEF domain-containing protein n=1 Tax=Xanthobacter cornucopiae TaxID=3119924 RepID=UPI00372B468E